MEHDLEWGVVVPVCGRVDAGMRPTALVVDIILMMTGLTTYASSRKPETKVAHHVAKVRASNPSLDFFEFNTLTLALGVQSTSS